MVSGFLLLSCYYLFCLKVKASPPLWDWKKKFNGNGEGNKESALFKGNHDFLGSTKKRKERW